MSPETNPTEERRNALRRVCRQHCLVRFDRAHLDGGPGTVGAEGDICDLSACGVGLLFRPALPVGASLAITPLGSPAVPLPPAHVVRCVPAGGRWRHGCCLGRALSDEELGRWLA